MAWPISRFHSERRRGRQMVGRNRAGAAADTGHAAELMRRETRGIALGSSAVRAGDKIGRGDRCEWMVGTGLAGVGIICRVPHNVSLGLLCSSRFARRNSVMKIDLNGKTAIVTGSSAGIGLGVRTRPRRGRRYGGHY